MSEITLGTKVFSRFGKLETLLESVPDEIDRVIVADDSAQQAHSRQVYRKRWPFGLQVIDLPHDAGLGRGREAIVEELDTEYLLITDTDHQVPDNVDALFRILEADASLGGVAGLLREDGEKTGLCHDIERHGRYHLRTFSGAKAYEEVGGETLLRWDFVPNVCLFRRAAVEDYCWDPAYTIEREHLDFYVGHLETDWEFGVCPEVVFPHDPGGGDGYTMEREAVEKAFESMHYFREKWSVERVLPRNDWLGVLNEHGAARRLPISPSNLPLWAQASFEGLGDVVWKAKARWP